MTPGIAQDRAAADRYLSGASTASHLIQRQLLWIAVGVILVSGALVVLVLFYQRTQKLEAGLRQSESFAQVIEEQTTRTLQTVDQQLQLAATNLRQLEAENRLNEASARLVLRGQLDGLPYVRAMWVLDAQGRIVYDSDIGNIGVSLADREYFQIYRDQPKTQFHVGAPVLSRSTGTWLISASRPLPADKGAFKGVIVAAVEPPYFDRLWRTVDLGAGGSVALLRTDGTLMMRSPFDASAMGKNFSGGNLFKVRLVKAPAASFQDTSPIDGAMRIYAYRTLAMHPDLVVVVGQRADAVLASWRHLAMLALAVWLAGSAGVLYLSMMLRRAWQQQARADEVARQMTQRFTLAIDAAEVAVWDWDLRTDQWYATATYYTMLGYPAQDGSGDRALWLARLHPQDRPAVVALINAVRAGADVPYQYEARIQHADGSYRWVRANGRVLERDDAGKPTRLMGVRYDVNDLKRAEETQRQVFERITDAFVALDTQWCYTYVNQKAGEMLGRDPAQLVGKNIWAEFPEGVGQKFHMTYEKAMAEQTPIFLEEYYPPYDRWFENRIYPSPEGLTIYFQDITERKRAQEELRLSEENLNITLMSIGEAVIATDAAGLITRMNPTAERLTGWPVAEARGRPLAEVFRIFNARTREPALDPVKQVIEKGGLMTPSNQIGMYSRDGQEFQISNSGAPIRDQAGQIVGAVVVFSDVTEKYRTQAALQESEAGLAAAQALAHLGSWTLDLQTLRGSWSAEEFRLHYRDPALGAPSFEEFLGLIDPVDVESVKALQAGVATMAEPVTIDYRTHPALGPVRHLKATMHLVRDEQGNAVRMEGSTLDVTERRQAEALIRAGQETLRESAQHTQTILDNLFDGVLSVDEHGRIELFNKGASKVFGYSPEEVLGRSVTMLMPEQYRKGQERFLQRYRESGEGEVVDKARELEGLHKDGRTFPISLSVSKISRGDRTNFVGIVRDITQQRKDIEEIRRLAFYDSLTSLPNRRLLLDRLGQAMVTSARSGQHGALMFLDLDHFKQLNDSLGHDLGDVLLQQAANRLQACVREGDSVARLGGDEFVILLEALSVHGNEAASQAEVVANKILDAFRQTFNLRGHAHHSTPSIGIVVFMGQTQSKDDLLKRADVAMYQAKAAGRNNARFFDPAMQAAVEARDGLEKELRRGMANQEFVLHYQIQVDAGGKPIGAEALVRWNHPSRGMVPPGEFIPLAEDTGLILALGQWVLETACVQLVQWASQAATAPLTLAVNVSAIQLAQTGFVDNVVAALKKTGADPGRLKLELTESMLVRDVEGIITKMNELKTHGVGFSLDDFGTGYSSLSYLKLLPLDQLKIDRSFVRDILSDPNDAAIARTIVALGHSLGLVVIAEGVETAAQRTFLRKLGCDAFQGYFFGRPAPADAVLATHGKSRK